MASVLEIAEAVPFEVAVAPAKPVPRPPWCRFAGIWICCCLCSGLIPGQAVFTKLFYDAGVFSSVCAEEHAGGHHHHGHHEAAKHAADAARAAADRPGGDDHPADHDQPEHKGHDDPAGHQHPEHRDGHPHHHHHHHGKHHGGRRLDDSAGHRRCKLQMVDLTGVFSSGNGLAVMFMAPIGVLYDRWGGRVCGVSGALTCATGLALTWVSVVGADMGYDSSTSWLFAIGILMCDFGSYLNSMCFYSLIWHFPGRQAFVISLVNATYQVGSFLPLLLQVLMIGFGIEFSTAMISYAAVTLLAALCLWRLTPDQREFYSAAKEVLGMPLPKPPKVLEPCKMIKKGLEVLRVYRMDHIMSAFCLSLGFCFPGFYGSFAAGYGKELFGSEADATRLANLYTMVNGFVGGALAPVGGSVADFFGLRVFLAFLAFLLFAGAATSVFASWISQTICCIVLVFFNTLLMLFVSRYFLHYAPPNRFGTVQGIYFWAVMGISIPLSIFGLCATAMMPNGPDAYRIPYVCYGAVGGLAMIGYSIYMAVKPLPELPPLLGDDEKQLANGFGCGTLDEVVQVVSGVSSRQELLRLLSSSDPDDTVRLIASIDPVKMAEIMASRPVEDIAEMLEGADMEDEEEEEEAADDVGQPTESEAPSAPFLTKNSERSSAAEKESGAQDMSRRNSVNSISSMGNNSDDVDSMFGDAHEDQDADPEADNRHIMLARRSQRLSKMIADQDKQGIIDYMMNEDVEHINELMMYQEESLTDAEHKKMDKEFNKLIPGGEFAKLLRRRPELKKMVQESVKRDMTRRVSRMKQRLSRSSKSSACTE